MSLRLSRLGIPPVISGDFTTDFSLTENPISQGAIWTNGGAVGLKWQNCQTVTGKAFGSGFAGSTGQGTEFDDNIAHLKTSFRTFANNQFAQGTVYRAGGYTPNTSHEVELFLRSEITANNARGYEVLWAIDGICAVVRWNGPLADSTNSNAGFTVLSDNNAIGAPADLDVLRAEIIGGVIKVYKNSGLVVTAPSDSQWASGQPGMGFWPRSGGNVVLANYGWRAFSAGDL